MNVFIVTQPLLNNYGGLLQNFALQKALKSLGCQVKTIDYIRRPSLPFWMTFLSWMKTILFFFIPGKRRRFVSYIHKGQRNPMSEDFCNNYIEKTPVTVDYKAFFKSQEAPCCVVVGSDQVWRPLYNYSIRDMFLDFCKERKNVKRIAYAASFGVDDWELSPKETVACSALVKKFDAISVREQSGVNLCNTYLGARATWVLDPTLLLNKDDYCDVCKSVPVTEGKILAAYVLDKSDSIRSLCESIAAERGLELRFFEAGPNATLTIPEWLAMFRDASYVVTDSFHGTVFSIIFNKDFKCLYNESRGATRFESLLEMYRSSKLHEMREFSLNWLKNALVS